MKEIRLGTTFSGIGAIEHALQRMNIKHKNVFACDNGGISLFNKKIEDRFSALENELGYLKSHVSKLKTKGIENYKKGLEAQLEAIEKAYIDVFPKCSKIEIASYLIETINDVLNLLDKEKDLKFDKFNKDDLDISDYLFISSEIKSHIKKKKEKNLFIKYVDSLEFISKDKEYRAIRRELKDISKKFSQLHESIGTLEVLDKLENFTTAKEKKEYIDSLYSKKVNFVKKSYTANYDIKDKDFHQNISFLDASPYKGKIDLYVGGSPCQSFSIVGKRGGFEDTRGTLFYEYARVLKECQPRFFIYENVKGVLSHDAGRTWETMKNVFEDTGYKFKDYILNAKDFGIPQHRERLFVIGFKDQEDYAKFEDPKKVELKFTMKDFLKDIVDEKYFLPKKGIKFVTDDKNLNKKYTQINGDIALCQKANQQFNWHGDFIEEYTPEEVKKMDKIEDKYFLSEKVKKYILDDKFFMNKKPSDKLIDLEIARPLTASMHKMHRAGVDNYISYGKSLDVNKRRIRKLTPVECFRLMGFCDSFNHVVSDTQLYHQSGNSIVVDVLISIMKELQKVINK